MKKSYKYLILIIITLFNYTSYAQWENIDFPIWRNSTIEGFNNLLFVGTYGEGLYYTDDLGDTWKKQLQIPDIQVHDFVEDPNNSVIFLSGSSSVFSSTDQGNNWTITNFSQMLFAPSNIYKLAFHHDKIFAVSFGQGAFVTEDLGVTWDSINNGLGDYASYGSGRFIYDMGQIEDRLFVCGANGVWYTDDDGENWIKDSFWWNDCYTNTIAIMDDKIFVGTDNQGIYVSNDMGDSWSEISNSVVERVRSFEVVNDEILFVGTITGKIYYYDENNNWNLISDGGTGGQIIMGLELFKDKLYSAGWDFLGGDDAIIRAYSSPLILDVENIEYNTEFLCYSDLSNNTIILKLPYDFDRVELYNIQGEICYYDNSVFAHTYEINTQGLVSGVYIVRIFEGQNSWTKKVFIQN